jgi:hypothetical protein
LARRVGMLRRQSAPDNQKLLASHGAEVFEKFESLRRSGRAEAQAEVEACATRPFGQSRLIYRGDGSSCWRVRRFGRCTLQLKARDKSYTRDSVRLTEKRHAMNVCMRGRVHRSMAKPAAVPHPRLWRCASGNYRDRPKRLSGRKASIPLSWRMDFQCDTVVCATPLRVAISPCPVPATTSRAQRRRGHPSQASLCVLPMTSNVTARRGWATIGQTRQEKRYLPMRCSMRLAKHG